jgi:hypothetical protein
MVWRYKMPVIKIYKFVIFQFSNVVHYTLLTAQIFPLHCETDIACKLFCIQRVYGLPCSLYNSHVSTLKLCARRSDKDRVACTCQDVVKFNNRMIIFHLHIFVRIILELVSKGCHLDVVRWPSTPHDPESDAGGSLSSWQATQAGKVKDEGRS